jgi:hypothetical protein
MCARTSQTRENVHVHMRTLNQLSVQPSLHILLSVCAWTSQTHGNARMCVAIAAHTAKCVAIAAYTGVSACDSHVRMDVQDAWECTYAHT